MVKKIPRYHLPSYSTFKSGNAIGLNFRCQLRILPLIGEARLGDETSREGARGSILPRFGGAYPRGWSRRQVRPTLEVGRTSRQRMTLNWLTLGVPQIAKA